MDKESIKRMERVATTATLVAVFVAAFAAVWFFAVPAWNTATSDARLVAFCIVVGGFLAGRSK